MNQVLRPLIILSNLTVRPKQSLLGEKDFHLNRKHCRIRQTTKAFFLFEISVLLAFFLPLETLHDTFTSGKKILLTETILVCSHRHR